MPNPTSSDRRVDALATDHSIAFIQEQEDALYGNAVAVQKVKKSSGKYAIFPTGTWNKRQATTRAPGVPASEGQFTISNDSYLCNLKGVKHKDPREETQQADEVFDPEEEATLWATGQALLEADAAIVAAMMAESVWDTDIDGTTGSPTVGTSVRKWSEAASDPITDMAQLNGIIKRKSTKWANVAVLGMDVWTVLLNHPAIVDRIKHTSSNSVRKEILASLFEVERVIVPGLVENTAELGQTATMAFLSGSDDVGLFYMTPSPGKRTMSAAYIYACDFGEYKEGVRVAKWYDEDKNSDMTQVDIYMDVKVVATSAGAFINDCVD